MGTQGLTEVSLELYLSLTLVPVAIEMGQAPYAQEAHLVAALVAILSEPDARNFSSVWKRRCLIRRFETTITTQHYG